jgi:hypothetical protein
VSHSLRSLLLTLLLLPGARAVLAQQPNLSPTLPSDTLEANYAPRSSSGPMPELAPSLPSDTLDATRRVDSFPNPPSVDKPREDSTPPDPTPASPSSSGFMRELKRWTDRHPGMELPPPVRAVSAQA